MSISTKVNLLLDEVSEYIDSLDDCMRLIPYDRVLKQSQLVQLSEGTLCSENGALIPTAVGLLKRKGHNVVTIKRSDSAGNAVVFIKVADVLICVFRSQDFEDFIAEALHEAEVPVKRGFLSRLLSRLAG